MENILEAIQIIGLIASLILTAIMVFTFRKPRLVTNRGKILSIAISLAMLLFYLLLTGARLNSAVSIPVFILGLIVGCIRGLTLRISKDENGQISARGSWFFLLAWGGSWLLIQILAFWTSNLLLSLSLIPVFLSTGVQTGLDGITLIRRQRVVAR